MRVLQRSVIIASCLLAFLHSAAADEDPVVTLKHGGQLQGVSYAVGEQKVDHFVSVRYGKPPVGELRFQKPEPADPWTGVELAQKGKAVCLHYAAVPVGKEQPPMGEEDCLFLDVVVPGGVSSDRKKPVMLWIHGGGYTLGHRMQYIPAVLAEHGDVIVVTINYRLGIFGFLSDGPGTGNYGLWDQRAAIMWVKDNIGSFGGDPDMITIFGESAGGGSVVAQMMGQHNEGLFLRAIPESGSLYLPWGWYLAPKDRDYLIGNLRESLSCEETSIYDCFKDMNSMEVLKSCPPMLFMFFFHPVPDGDFFPESVNEDSYDLANRFDLLTGFNGMEGNLFTGAMLGGYLAKMNKSLEDGCSAEDMQTFLQMSCGLLVSKESPELCTYFINKEYGIDEASDDFERVMRFTEFAGEINFNEDQVRLLLSHSKGDKATYGYQFHPYVTAKVDEPFWFVPERLKNTADHGDELAFVFGVQRMTDEMFDLYSDYKDDLMLKMITGARGTLTEPESKMSDQVMTLWTNFAKSGNPNEPVKVDSFPDWPEFTSEDKKLMMIDYDSQLIDIPNKERMERMRAILLKSRDRRVKGDSPVPQPAAEQENKAHDEL